MFRRQVLRLETVARNFDITFSILHTARRIMSEISYLERTQESNSGNAISGRKFESETVVRSIFLPTASLPGAIRDTDCSAYDRATHE